VRKIHSVLVNDFNEEWTAEAEADAYVLFSIIVTEMRVVVVPGYGHVGYRESRWYFKHNAAVILARS
jgi:hypothetical protein